MSALVKTHATARANPLDCLLAYQRDWVREASRFKIGLWARQTGKSFSTAAEAVCDCIQRKTTWVTLSAGERQALEWMQKAREWAQAFEVALEDDLELRDDTQAILKAAEIRWNNGSRLIAIPANPATARGYSANLTLDEFAFHEDPDAIWRAIYPSISNPLKGVFKVRIVSTPNGQSNRFHDLWTKDNQWSKHKIDIHAALARGLEFEPGGLEALRDGLDDPTAWSQEFECEFLDSATVLLPYELLARCESAEACTSQPDDYWTSDGAPAAPVFAGIDFGRRHDLTVCWSLSQEPGPDSAMPLMATIEVLELSNLDTPAQLELLRPRLARATRAALDYTGPGVGLGDWLVREFGEWKPDGGGFGKVELCGFTNTLKADLFSKLKMDFETGCVRIPVSRIIREDLHSVRRVTTSSGLVTYRAPHTEGGHADRAVALALALRAARSGSQEAGGFRAYASLLGSVNKSRRDRTIWT